MTTLNIITVVRNDPLGIQRTIYSLLNFAKRTPHLHFFHHIQDGNSQDHTKSSVFEILNKNKLKNYKFRFKTEKDVGIYDAMNKAAKEFKVGDLIVFMNAGDEFSERSDAQKFLAALKDFISRRESLAFFRSRNVFQKHSYFMPSIDIKSTNSFKIWVKSHTPVHQAIIFKIDKKYALKFPSDFTIQSDTYLIYTILKKYSNPVFYDLELCKFELGGLSGDYKSFSKVLLQTREQIKIMRLRDQGIFAITIISVTLLIKFFLHSLLGSKFIWLHIKINQMIKN